MTRRYNISKPEKYMKDGVEKTQWQNVGTMTEFERQDKTISRIIEIPAIGLKANVFEIKPKDTPVLKVEEEEKEPADLPPIKTEEINPDDIPF